MIGLDDVLQMLTDIIKENGFTLKCMKSRQYPKRSIMNTDYAVNIAFLANSPTQAESQLNHLEKAGGGIGFSVKANKMESFNKGAISILNGGPLKLVDKLMYLSSRI